MRLQGPSSVDTRGRWAAALALAAGVAGGLLLGWQLLSPSQATAPEPDGEEGTSFRRLLPLSTATGEAALTPAPVVGAPAPDFTLATLDGGSVTLSELRGHPVLINFWASWCSPCRIEMHDLVRAYRDLQDEGLVILGVNLTFQDSMPEVWAFVEEFQMTFPVLLDETGEVTERKYRLVGLPMSVFVDREGVIRRIHLGLMSGEQIDDFIGEIVGTDVAPLQPEPTAVP